MSDFISALQELGEGIVSLFITAEEIVFFAGIAVGAIAMFFLLSYIFQVVACWRIFKKAGQGGWKSLIPVYSSYIRYQITWRPLWFWLSGLVMISAIVLRGSFPSSSVTGAVAPVLGIAGGLIYAASLYHTARAFGHGILFALGLLLFYPLFILILGLGGSEYQGPWHGRKPKTEAPSPEPAGASTPE